MKTYPADRIPRWRDIPKTEWPSTIASLHPERVTVYNDSVDIQTRSFFDGGWGYNVPRSKSDLPMPPQCYTEPVKGVFWHGPC